MLSNPFMEGIEIVKGKFLVVEKFYILYKKIINFIGFVNGLKNI